MDAIFGAYKILGQKLEGKLMNLNSLIENFKKEPLIIKILMIAFVISFICNVLTFKYFDITIVILGMLAAVEIFMELGKKED